MGRVTRIKTDSVFLLLCLFLGEKQERRWKRNERRSTEREREREREKKGEWERRRRKAEEERKEGSGVASTLDWNLKIPGSIPGSTLREIIHPKTTKTQVNVPFCSVLLNFLCFVFCSFLFFYIFFWNIFLFTLFPCLLYFQILIASSLCTVRQTLPANWIKTK